MNHIEQFEKDFNTKLTEREIMIFNYAYNAHLKDLDLENEVVTEIKNVSMSSIQSRNLYTNTDSLARSLNVKCDVQYVNMTFSFPSNTMHYRIIVEGKRKDVGTFFNKIW